MTQTPLNKAKGRKCGKEELAVMTRKETRLQKLDNWSRWNILDQKRHTYFHVINTSIPLENPEKGGLKKY